MKISAKEYIDVITLRKAADATKAANALLAGRLLVMKMGSIWGLFLNPQKAHLAADLNKLKMRDAAQSLSLICACDHAKKIADKERVNRDFFAITPDFCRKVITRFPLNMSLDLPFPHDAGDGSVQFQSFEAAHPILREIQRLLLAKGCPYLSGTSANIHGAPTIETLADAKRLAVVFNIEASFFRMKTETIVVDIPAANSGNKGSFPIVGFGNRQAIEVIRLVNKTDRKQTNEYLAPIIAAHRFETPVVFTD